MSLCAATVFDVRAVFGMRPELARGLLGGGGGRGGEGGEGGGGGSKGGGGGEGGNIGQKLQPRHLHIWQCAISAGSHQPWHE